MATKVLEPFEELKSSSVMLFECEILVLCFMAEEALEVIFLFIFFGF